MFKRAVMPSSLFLSYMTLFPFISGGKWFTALCHLWLFFFFKHRSSSLIGYISLCISFSVSLISFHTLLVLPFLVGKWFKDELLWCHYSWTLEQHWSYLQTLSIFNNIVSWFSKFRSSQEWNQCFLVW